MLRLTIPFDCGTCDVANLCGRCRGTTILCTPCHFLRTDAMWRLDASIDPYSSGIYRYDQLFFYKVSQKWLPSWCLWNAYSFAYGIRTGCAVGGGAICRVYFILRGFWFGFCLKQPRFLSLRSRLNGTGLVWERAEFSIGCRREGVITKKIHFIWRGLQNEPL